MIDVVTVISEILAVTLGYTFLGMIGYEADKDMLNKIKNKLMNWLRRGADAHRAEKPWLRR